VEPTNAHLKVYISVVYQLKEMIQRDRLTTGDRLPSERELSERLGVGRSSVREAFRALELLGLIETRHGEGTFLRDFRDHRLVELLGMFILQNGQAEHDVIEMKEWIEFSSIKRLFSSSQHSIDMLFDTIFSLHHRGELSTPSQLKAKLIEFSGNKLSYKVWLVLHEFDFDQAKEEIELSEDQINRVKKSLLSKDAAFLLSFCSSLEPDDYNW